MSILIHTVHLYSRNCHSTSQLTSAALRAASKVLMTGMADFDGQFWDRQFLVQTHRIFKGRLYIYANINHMPVISELIDITNCTSLYSPNFIILKIQGTSWSDGKVRKHLLKPLTKISIIVLTSGFFYFGENEGFIQPLANAITNWGQGHHVTSLSLQHVQVLYERYDSWQKYHFSSNLTKIQKKKNILLIS